MVSIKNITALEILDSRGNPTVEVTLYLSDGQKVVASVPSGISVGKYEALELRDKDPARYNGMGVLQAIRNVNEVIAPKLVNLDPVRQGSIDKLLIELDGTPNKSRLGSNAILAVSLAVCRAGAAAVNLPLYKYISELINANLPKTIDKMPTPTFNIINGGKHGTGNLDFQEFHVVPASNKRYHEALRIGEEVYQKLKQVLTSRNAIHSVGDEGGFTPNLYTNTDALELMMEAIHMTRYRFGIEIFLGLDLAASNFKSGENYHIKDQATSMNTLEFIEYLANIHRDYRLLILEDPLSEDDWQGWKTITERLGKEVLLVGDDFLATNPDRLQKAISEKACSAILVKPNQIGSVSETLAVIKMARTGGLKIIVSHRSGETNDAFVADLAVGVSADYVKFGAPARGERVAKYNRLIHIESELKLI
ncbi:MAG: Enolase [Candidatus Gottesmanbacteria bacterium GW2011_GWB1_43_11]|uniref:Enolase n=1 Tax=Candidatus Gottesmanbacteria bacterium GW2011_GWB1_43_11 TaxID=1618446 RepID=A0A0G1CNJ3_9BACT|nr:MAG: Enolase [Candidatus Gottesmanbacteria bacterium GW2011_GWA2_42_16]KKS54479.1 MAG: Enolase [Candidatus Gottesmanbacteria bacterium GW2011_GWA1_42_26]KKS82211.1 MAG: enolase, enolase [Candidatus Gottesmanbacteria bacterium GW2011_GWC1_43_10]KKS87109.1 MAG: Enolase [Candidatus Gottesmanbacteria bacterium GW2011_GWB1_43_11]OGG10403.1 MAG: phosphopyruvate hydratase [Candidatus Gottesmanbacteria bacterium RIFCSPHIGHO2_01_FULL_43_15]OGG27718.1 MAG: phosphopyruvate hydratase [Candidatus Gottes